MTQIECTPVFSSASTRLPTCKQDGIDDDSYIDIAVLSQAEFQAISRGKACSVKELLATAWAILLRTYISSDRVLFGIVEENSSRYAEFSDGTFASCEWHSRSSSIRSSWDGLLPTITSVAKSSLPESEGQVNTILSYTSQKTGVQRAYDYQLLCDCVDRNVGGIDLRVRKVSVPFRFGNAVADGFRGILIAVASRNATMLEEAMLSVTDRERILGFTRRPLFDQQDCLHNLIREHVDESPDAEAVCAWDGKLTYQELDNFSNHMARMLVNIGVRSGQYIPFAFEKSMWSVVAVLGILKSGAAFVPIDPAQPFPVIRQTLTDIGATVLLSSESLKTKFQTLVKKVVVVSATTVTLSLAQEDVKIASLPKVQPADAAFVLFTSGSTGKPKGMVLQHGAYSTHTICHGNAMKYHGARVLQFAAHTFDVFVMDIFATLAFGGCVCIPSEEDRKFHIVQALHDFKVDLAILTPSFAHLLEPKLITGLKILAVGGEALKRETVSKWISDAPEVELIQIYGPAEVGICILGRLDSLNSHPEWLGYPLENSRCFLVDPDDGSRLVPMGATGELVVAGPTMLREYLNSPEKTQASFLDDPLWARTLKLPYRRFYRSGDLLRYNINAMDGSFEFVGRKDSQVKYHGQRMELEGIEHHLSSISSVAACMVSLPKQGVMNGKLVAVLQEKHPDDAKLQTSQSISVVSDSNLTLEKMRAHLSERLPRYMIPNALLVVQNMPFTASLKLNRPQVNHWLANLQSEVIAGEVVQKLHCDVLTVEETVARAISFEYARLVAGYDHRRCAALEGHDFSLQAGGIDSIQIISLSNFLQKTWGVRIPMSIILSSRTTIRDLADRIGGGDREDSQPDAASINVPSMATEIRSLVEELLTSVPKERVQAESQNVLLTGATGFLGVEILHSLLAQGMKVFALVRASDHAAARQRLLCEAKRAGWWSEIYASRLEIWLGNLCSPFLGLDEFHRCQIIGSCSAEERVHVIIHNGAKVHYGLDYHSLKDTNVSSTFELLRLTRAAKEPLASFVYVSGGQQLTFDDEIAILDSTDVAVEHGYARSKLISETLVRECMRRPEFRRTRLCVVKPGYIIGNADDGTPNKTDFLWRLVASCVEIGAYNEDDADRWVFVASKGRVATAAIENALYPVYDPIIKITDGIRFSRVWHMIRDEFCFDLVPLPRRQWLGRIEKVIEAEQQSHVMFPLLHLLKEGEPIGSLEGPSVASPGVENALRANLKVLVQAGYLKRH